MPVFIDQTGRKIETDKIPRHIISLVPSQTELLHDLGLDKEVIGITKFCIHPKEWFRTKTRVGGTKQVRLEIIHQLRPDLIIANKEENVKEQIEELAKHYPVWISDVSNHNDAYDMIGQVGKMTGKEETADALITRIKTNFSQLGTLNPIAIESKPRACYLIWRNPYMTIGGDTFIHSMLETAGFENIFNQKQRYPEINIEELAIGCCQLLLLPSEPFPFKANHVEELQFLLPETKIMLVDGEMFGWYGSRLLRVPGYFKKLQLAIENRE